MAERLKALWQKILDWWNQFTAKQKTLIVGAGTVVVLTIIILVTVLNQPQYYLLAQADSAKEASQIKELLDSNSINYKMSDDGLEFRVLKKDKAEASLLLGANDIQSYAYSIENVTEGSFSTTESDKQKKYVKYLQSELEHEMIVKFDAIESANITLNIPDNDGTLIGNKDEASAFVILDISDPDSFGEENAVFLAKGVATALGKKTTNDIVIMDTASNLLFSGSEETTDAGIASTQLNLKTKAEQIVKSEVKKVLLGTKLYDDIEVASNLVMDNSKEEYTEHNYTPAEDQTQGVLSHESIYNAENVNGVSGIPGTDTNEDDMTTYVTQDNTNSSSTISEETRDYLPNEDIKTRTTLPGSIKYDESSISVTAINYVVMKEENYDKAANGDLSWNEYKTANTEPVALTVPEDMINVVSKATGIAAENVAMAAYTQYVFLDKTGANITVTDILQILTILIILGLLAFIVIRSMWTSKKTEEEPEPEELSVEQLLESQPEEVLSDIEMDTGSETKRLIEKFVDENPEAAATLLRNWLNEDYGV
ncbi:flagellar M-ring protein FliF C-terminal domain-containing protein [Butyrivibrio sp. INlla14]|uniref:flagellar M-ring protein FliF C-terminal domain-containing protein n=1 Tax=Butyrivibrio sp. INlla14 TaxID=1520808 RepID=UPI000876E0CB|nr:flagellar M-ring protein FliF C-terminal domain-containing protein [Butyrivibrio sp. INlla14]SCY58712.1 flagellar M-ring protein FliF [Butyrivibrio sp. INlla14]